MIRPFSASAGKHILWAEGPAEGGCLRIRRPARLQINGRLRKHLSKHEAKTPY